MNRKENSFWEENSFLLPADVVIIGGGIVGLSTSIKLKQERPDLRVVVLDRDPFGFGGTTRNAGFACFGSPSEVLSDLETMGEEAVLSLLQMRWKGLTELRRLLGDKQIGYQNCGGIELFEPSEEALSAKCFEALPSLNRLLKSITNQETYIPYQGLNDLHFNGFSAAIMNPLEGSIDTGKMAYALRSLALKEGVELYAGVEVKSLTTDTNSSSVKLAFGEIQAKQVLVCTNGFAKQLLPSLDVTPARNLVLMTSEIPDLNWEGTFHVKEGYFYFRNVGRRILIGGGRHLDDTWSTAPNEAVPDHVKAKLTELLRSQIVPNSKFDITHEWTGYLGIGAKRNVIQESINPHLHVAVRMGGMGIAIGSHIGAELAKTTLQLL